LIHVTKAQYAIYVIYKLESVVEWRQYKPAKGTDMIKAVIFDMDGTLVDTERLDMRAWKVGAAELGIAIDNALVHQFIGRSMPDVRDILEEHYGSREIVETVEARYRNALDEMVKTDLELKAGAAECLDELLARAITWVLRRRRAALRPSATLRRSASLTSLKR